MCPAQEDMTDNDIVRRGYLNVIRNPQGGVVRDLTVGSNCSQQPCCTPEMIFRVGRGGGGVK